MRRAALLIAWMCSCGLAAGGCRDRAATPPDAGYDAPLSEVPPAENPGPLALDFAVTGCARYDVGAVRCTGQPPLTVTFSPVGSAALTRFLWTFGDGTPPSSERAPTHTYVVTGDFDVSLVAEGTVGSLSRVRPKMVSVTALPTGAPCDVDAQCGALRCACRAGAGCGSAFARGLCTTECPATGCGAHAVCATVDLPAQANLGSPGAAPDGGTDGGSAVDAAGGLSRALCLAACDEDASCPGGFVCRTLPDASGASTRWTRGCLPPAFQELGSPCRNGAGELTDRQCASGLCADVGALGLCAAACDTDADCPAGSACGKLGNGESLCLSTCAAGRTCARDPLLACERPGAPGPLGFQVAAPAADVTFCAPRRCSSDADCGPTGACTPPGVGAHCSRR
jgi:PKD repeat protein